MTVIILAFQVYQLFVIVTLISTKLNRQSEPKLDLEIRFKLAFLPSTGLERKVHNYIRQKSLRIGAVAWVKYYRELNEIPAEQNAMKLMPYSPPLNNGECPVTIILL